MKKITAVVLLMAMLASMAACSNTETEETENGTDTTNVVDSTATDTEETRPMHKLSEDLDFDGDTFNIAYPDWQGYRYYFFADEATGDAMNDAIYNRKVKTEEFLNVSILQSNIGSINDIPPEIKKVVQAGDDVYSLALLHCMSGVYDMVTKGYIYNFDDLPNIDMSADWWNREQMDVLRLGKNTYYGVSDFMIPCPYAIFFNKEMIENNNMENPYDLVYEGKWTLDKYTNMCVSVARDVNGDGQYTKDDDIWGMTCDEFSKYVPFMTAAGQFMTSSDKDGKVQLDFYTEKSIHIVEVLSNLINTSSAVYVPDGMAEEDMVQMSSGRLLFRLGSIVTAETYRDCEVDIGILPYPKYDEEQENYISQDWGGLMCVPITIQKPEMVGATLEYLSWETATEVIPAYYDKTLSGKLARDENSVKMLDILFDTIAYEIGGNYFGSSGGFNQLYYVIGNMVLLGNSSDFASFYAKNEKSAISTIDKFYEALDKIEN